MATPSSVLLVELVMSIDRLIESAKKAKPKADQWSAAVTLGHVSQVDLQVWLPRVQLMVDAFNQKENPPIFTWWEPDAVETQREFADVPLEQVSGIAMQARTQLVSRLRNLTPEEWSAPGIHATFGQITVGDLIFQTLTHDEEHRASFV